MERQITKDIEQMKNDLTLIKEILLSRKELDDEGELTDWAKGELAKARALPDSEYVSLKEIEKRILAK